LEVCGRDAETYCRSHDSRLPAGGVREFCASLLGRDSVVTRAREAGRSVREQLELETKLAKRQAARELSRSARDATEELKQRVGPAVSPYRIELRRGALVIVRYPAPNPPSHQLYNQICGAVREIVPEVSQVAFAPLDPYDSAAYAPRHC
jgi:hypothetical protein